MDFLDKERNLAHLEQSVRCAESGSWRQLGLALHTYMQADQARLSEKRRCMQLEDTMAGEARQYPYSLLGIDERVELFEKRRRELWHRLEQVQALVAFEREP